MPPDDRDHSTHVGHLRFGAAGQGTPAQKPAPTPPPTPKPKPAATPARASASPPLRGVSAPTPEMLDDLEHTWLGMLERETAKMPPLTQAFHADRPATPAEIAAVVVHAQQIETWYANFLPVARQLAEHGRTRLIERVNAYLDDTRATVAIYKKMHEDACASDRTLHTIMAASNDDTHTRFGAMHDARQAVFDEANALWWKSFKS